MSTAGIELAPSASSCDSLAARTNVIKSDLWLSTANTYYSTIYHMQVFEKPLSRYNSDCKTRPQQTQSRADQTNEMDYSLILIHQCNVIAKIECVAILKGETSR